MSRILALFKANTASFPSDIIDSIVQAGGAPVQIWSEDGAFFAVIAEGDPSVQTVLAAHPAVACATSESLNASYAVDPAATELAAAWNSYVGNDYQTAVDNFYTQPLDVSELFPPGGCFQGLDENGGDTGGGRGDGGDSGGGPLVASAADAPGSNSTEPAATMAPDDATSASAGAPGVATATVVHKERRALVGNVGVAVAYVGGPKGTSAELTASDNCDIALLIMHAFDVYYNLAPKAAHLVFEVSMKRTTITIDPATIPQPANRNAITGAEYEAAEAPWRDNALVVFGQSSGWPGVDSMIAQGAFSTTPDYAYAAFFTNYPAAWMAYNSSARKIVFQLAMTRANWKPAGLHFVFAHESGHTSGAPDEYAHSKCATTDLAGFSHTANTNCENGGTAVACLMFKNSPHLCPATPGHFGWNDTNGDGILDPFDPTYAMT